MCGGGGVEREREKGRERERGMLKQALAGCGMEWSACFAGFSWGARHLGSSTSSRAYSALQQALRRCHKL